MVAAATVVVAVGTACCGVLCDHRYQLGPGRRRRVTRQIGATNRSAVDVVFWRWLDVVGLLQPFQVSNYQLISVFWFMNWRNRRWLWPCRAWRRPHPYHRCALCLP